MNVVIPCIVGNLPAVERIVVSRDKLAAIPLIVVPVIAVLVAFAMMLVVVDRPRRAKDSTRRARAVTIAVETMCVAVPGGVHVKATVVPAVPRLELNVEMIPIVVLDQISFAIALELIVVIAKNNAPRFTKEGEKEREKKSDNAVSAKRTLVVHDYKTGSFFHSSHVKNAGCRFLYLLLVVEGKPSQ